jgi:4-hydroxybutyrate CoA-transferase
VPLRLVSPERAVAEIRSGERVFLGSACGEPQTLVDELVVQHDRLRSVNVVTGLQGSAAPYTAPELASSFRLETFMVSGPARAAVERGDAVYIPCRLSRIPRLFEDGTLPIDVALIQVSPPDRHGFCSLGVTVAYTKAAARAARLVIAEVNERMPRTFGDAFIHVDEIELAVETDRPLLQVAAPEPEPGLDSIGEHVASIVPDGATVQIGVGAMADATWRALAHHRDLGVHSGSLADAVVDLIEGGAVTNARKRVHTGRTVAGQLIGTPKLYDYADGNPSFALATVDTTHDPRVIARLDGFVSVNSAVQVDLTGQVNSETIRGRQIAGVGGAIDFAMGASLARDGKSIVALRSLSRKGDSRIVASMQHETITTPASLVDFVVTEHGIAALAGRSAAERARALVAVADPSVREELERWPG